MTEYEQSLDTYKISAPNRIGGFRGGFSDATLGGLNWIKGDRDRAMRDFGAHFNRVTDADGNYRHNLQEIIDRAG